MFMRHTQISMSKYKLYQNMIYWIYIFMIIIMIMVIVFMIKVMSMTIFII